MRSAGAHQRIEHQAGRSERHMQLPAQLAHIGDPKGAHRMTFDLDAPGMAEGKGEVGAVDSRHRLEHVSGSRPHQGERAKVFGDVPQLGIETTPDMIADPGAVMGAKSRAGHDIEEILLEAGDGEIALDPAFAVQELGIGQSPGRTGDVVRRDPVQRRHRVPAGQLELRERGLIEQADRLAHQPVLFAHRLEPVRPAHRGHILRRHAIGREPVRPLPAELGAEHRAVPLQALVER